MTATSTPKLFQPITVGASRLQHRVVMPPMTRCRATEDYVPTDIMVEYYGQRASTPGTLIIAEATYVSEKGAGLKRQPGLWSQEQIVAWKKVTDAVHAKGSFIWVQMWALGRSARPDVLQERGLPYVGASTIRHPQRSVAPRPLTIPEIEEYVQDFATAAKNAIAAGFDGVEVHAANGYLIDQFLQTITNDRTDEYGGSVENRIRFADEVVDAVVDAIGEDRTGMGMSDPIPTFSALLRRIDAKHPGLAFVHAVEPVTYSSAAPYAVVEPSNAFIDEIRLPRPVIHAGEYTRQSGLEAAEKDGFIVAFGQSFVANPDLPTRLRTDTVLEKSNPNTYYEGEEMGYVDYPFAAGWQRTPVAAVS